MDTGNFMHAAQALSGSAGFRETEPYPQSQIPPHLHLHALFMEKELPA